MALTVTASTKKSLTPTPTFFFYQANCPRKGKPPSQWRFEDEEIVVDADEAVVKDDGQTMMDC